MGNWPTSNRCGFYFVHFKYLHTIDRQSQVIDCFSHITRKKRIHIRKCALNIAHALMAIASQISDGQTINGRTFVYQLIYLNVSIFSRTTWIFMRRFKTICLRMLGINSITQWMSCFQTRVLCPNIETLYCLYSICKWDLYGVKNRYLKKVLMNSSCSLKWAMRQ